MRVTHESRLSSSLSIVQHAAPLDSLTKSSNMYVNKFYSLVAAILLQLMGGLCYTFALYSSNLKTALNIDQPSLEFIASCLLSGGYFSWIPGRLPRVPSEMSRDKSPRASFPPAIQARWQCLRGMIDRICLQA